MTEALTELTPFWVPLFIGWLCGIFTMLALYVLIALVEREDKKSQEMWMAGRCRRSGKDRRLGDDARAELALKMARERIRGGK